MYQRALKALGPRAQRLPTYGVGHSLGSLLQLLLASRYVVQPAGNILMSFNNKPGEMGWHVGGHACLPFPWSMDHVPMGHRHAVW